MRTWSPSREFQFFSADSLVTRLPNKTLRSHRQACSRCATPPFVRANARRMYLVCAWFALWMSDSCVLFGTKRPFVRAEVAFSRKSPRDDVLWFPNGMRNATASEQELSFGKRNEPTLVNWKRFNPAVRRMAPVHDGWPRIRPQPKNEKPRINRMTRMKKDDQAKLLTEK